MASGFCPVQALLAAGANVAIGTDGTCSNNTLDMIAEMKMAAILAKGVSKDAAAVPALEAVKMATLNGAKALGLESKIGSVVAGKYAGAVPPVGAIYWPPLNRHSDFIFVAFQLICCLEADLIAIELSSIESMPMFDVVSHVVYATTRNQVTDVWVAGQQVATIHAERPIHPAIARMTDIC